VDRHRSTPGHGRSHGDRHVDQLGAGVNDSGSPELADEWRATLQPLSPSGGDLRIEYPEIEFVRFPNGEWVIGFARNSHGLFVGGGGSLVLKDSRGDLRAFFDAVGFYADRLPYLEALQKLDRCAQNEEPSVGSAHLVSDFGIRM
jgi:hypothetical protein